jgi:hypothetical protein
MQLGSGKPLETECGNVMKAITDALSLGGEVTKSMSDGDYE